MNQQQKSSIKAILQSPHWIVAEQVVEEVINGINQRVIIADNEWETLKNAVLYEGERRGIKEFINKLYQYANDET